ncbi:hypothetical protein [Actinobaculum suis]|nr:hypothetical protein [Actinobaculum suis]
MRINRDWLDVVLFWGRRFEIRWADELNLMNEVVSQNMPQLE